MSTTEYNARGGMRNVWIITASMTVLAICYTMIIPFLPIYLLELGVPKDDVALWSGLVFGITFLIAGVMAPIVGKLRIIRARNGWPYELVLLLPFPMFLLAWLVMSMNYC